MSFNYFNIIAKKLKIDPEILYSIYWSPPRKPFDETSLNTDPLNEDEVKEDKDND